MSKYPLFSYSIMTYSFILFQSALYGQNTTAANHSQTQKVNEYKKSEVEKQRQWAENEIQKNMIPETAHLIESFRKTIHFIKEGKINEAQETIKQALEKINALKQSNKTMNALLPIDFNIDVIDEAPPTLDAIRGIIKNVKEMIKSENYPVARLFLNQLQSEIDITSYCLPLVLYPIELRKASDFLNQNKPNEAVTTLQDTLHTLIIIEQIIPIPVIQAKASLQLAEENQKDQNAVLLFLNLTQYELERAKELGYAAKMEQDYDSINKEINDLKTKITNNESNPSHFQNLKNKFNLFLKKYFEEKKQENQVMKR